MSPCEKSTWAPVAYVQAPAIQTSPQPTIPAEPSYTQSYRETRPPFQVQPPVNHPHVYRYVNDEGSPETRTCTPNKVPSMLCFLALNEAHFIFDINPNKDGY
ncbi:hypothetical protein N7488_000029 [Penicillium malachiteum]|nr:hypothetical protein N7488_000029 [Penicillium malachiteum]